MHARAAESGNGATVERKKPDWRWRQVNAQAYDRKRSMVAVNFKSYSRSLKLRMKKTKRQAGGQMVHVRSLSQKSGSSQYSLPVGGSKP
jgi:hypothetical protein